MTRVTGIVLILALIPPVLAPELISFILVALVYGATIGSMDARLSLPLQQIRHDRRTLTKG